MSVQLPLNIRWNAAAELERFVAGDNGEALRLVTALADGALSAPVAYLHGAASVGKSHLLQGACRRVTAGGGVAVYLPLDQLLDHGPVVLEGWERAHLVALDHLDLLGSIPGAWQDALFHLYNRTVDRGGRMLFAARHPPGELPLAFEDLRSRLAWGPIIPVHHPDDAICLTILRQRAAERGLELPPRTARYLLRRMPRELSQLLALFETLDRASLAAGRRLTIPFVRQVLAASRSRGEDTSASP